MASMLDKVTSNLPFIQTHRTWALKICFGRHAGQTDIGPIWSHERPCSRGARPHTPTEGVIFLSITMNSILVGTVSG